MSKSAGLKLGEEWVKMFGTCLVCDATVATPAGVMKAEIVSCASCGQEHEVLDCTGGIKLGLAPEVEEDWGE